MASICNKCLRRVECESIHCPLDCFHLDCKDYVPDENKPKDFVLIHRYEDTNHMSIIAFSNSLDELDSVSKNHPRYGSSRHSFIIVSNDDFFPFVTEVKDCSLINICKNVAEYLAVGEYAMLKKSYFKASAWFEKAKNSAFLGADIIDNY